MSTPPLMAAAAAESICSGVVVMLWPKPMRARSVSRMYLRWMTSPVSSPGMPLSVVVPKPKA